MTWPVGSKNARDAAMTNPAQRKTSGGDPVRHASAAKLQVKLIVGLAVLTGIVVLLAIKSPFSNSEVSDSTSNTTDQTRTQSGGSDDSSRSKVAYLKQHRRSASAPAPNQNPTDSSLPPLTEAKLVDLPDVLPNPTSPTALQAKQMIGQIAGADFGKSPLTRQQVANLRGQLKDLVKLGPDAVPAIREYLRAGENVNFSSTDGANLPLPGSLRMGLIDAMGQIEGPEALTGLAKTLQGSTDPREIALLAQQLEKQSPGQYRDLALAAAHDSLALALSGKLGGDITPLFQVMQNYGDTRIISDLEAAARRWGYSPALALAELPDGAGISALIQVAKDPEVKQIGNGDVALRALAQVALDYPEARTTLVEQARSNSIPDQAWPSVAAGLSGTIMRIASTGDAAAARVGTVPSRVPDRLAVIDELLAAHPSAAAVQALQKARATLAKY